MSVDVFEVLVALHDRCPNCGSSTASATIRRLLCDGCECSRGYVSRELRAFLENFVHEFGWPNQPIVLRTGRAHEPEQRAVAAETEPKLKRKGKRKMLMNDLFPSKYLRAADLKGKSPHIVTIDWKMLVAITGAEDDEDWAGHRVRAALGEGEFAGRPNCRFGSRSRGISTQEGGGGRCVQRRN